MHYLYDMPYIFRHTGPNNPMIFFFYGHMLYIRFSSTHRPVKGFFRDVVINRSVYTVLTQDLYLQGDKPPYHDDVIKWKNFPRYWPFVRVIHRSPVNSPYKGQWRGALMFSLICAEINDWVNDGKADDVRRNRVHYDVTARLLDLV